MHTGLHIRWRWFYFFIAEHNIAISDLSFDDLADSITTDDNTQRFSSAIYDFIHSAILARLVLMTIFAADRRLFSKYFIFHLPPRYDISFFERQPRLWIRADIASLTINNIASASRWYIIHWFTSHDEISSAHFHRHCSASRIMIDRRLSAAMITTVYLFPRFGEFRHFKYAHHCRR